MVVKDISFPSLVENVLFDEVLLYRAEHDEAGEMLRFWESPQVGIVLGRASDETKDVDLARAQEDFIPVLRRCSGGGTVVQGPGCLNYAIVIAKDRHSDVADLKRSYQYILTRVLRALKVCGIDAVFMPISDLACKESQKKFSGNAQKRGRRFILHHGTILYQFDIQSISQYLPMPVAVPEYRNGRSHQDFLATIPIKPDFFKRSLAQEFGATESQEFQPAEKAALSNWLKNKDITLRLA